MKLLRRLRVVLTESDVEATGLWLGSLSVLWGLALCNPAVQTFETVRAWQGLAVLAPEWVWGGLLVALGLAKIHGVLRECLAWARWSSAAGFVVWAFIAVQLFLANPSAVGWLTYSMVACGSGWLYLRLSGALRP